MKNAPLVIFVLSVVFSSAGDVCTEDSVSERHQRVLSTETALWIASVEGMRDADLADPETHVDLRFYSSVEADPVDESKAQDELPPDIERLRADYLRRLGLARGDILKSARCYGRRGAPPPPEAKQEWLASFPAYCDSLSQVATIAFETPRSPHIDSLCQTQDVVYGDSDPPPANDRTRLVRAVRITGGSWARYDLRLDASPDQDTWETTTIRRCQVISS